MLNIWGAKGKYFQGAEVLGEINALFSGIKGAQTPHRRGLILVQSIFIFYFCPKYGLRVLMEAVLMNTNLVSVRRLFYSA